MKLMPISSDFASKLRTKLRRLSRELAFNVTTERAKPSSLVLLGNGDPDDVVVGILAHHLNGKSCAAIVKSDLTRMSALKYIPRYVSSLKSISTIVEIFDQEEDSLDSIFEKAEKVLKDKNVAFELLRDSERLRVYGCHYGGREVKLALVVSGLDIFEKHNIEEHLLLVATDLGIVNFGDVKTNPKLLWRKLPNEKRLEILRELANRKSLAKKHFLQHWMGLELIH